jgi:glycosyltransferase involved in cell wall biosynthesis
MTNRNQLRVAVASIGRFHMFDLARQLAAAKTGVLLLTGYPQFKVDNDLRPFTKTHGKWVLVERLISRLRIGMPPWLPYESVKDFGAWVARSLEGADAHLLDALDGAGLEAGRMFRDRGRGWLCNRGSAHVLTQKLLLEEEHRAWRVPMPKHYFWPANVDRCLAEYGGADGVVVPSRFAARSFIDRGHAPEKVHICPYGVDLSMFRPEPKRDPKFRVLFVGAQSLRKGIGYLFEAVRPLVESGAIELWLIGPAGTDVHELLRRNAALFRHHGVVPRNKLAWYYSQCSVLVLPSIEEGLALVQAQAMACGMPVIATTNTGAEDLFTDGVEGFILPIRQPAAIREKIELLLDDPHKRDSMAMASLARVADLGGWNAYGARVRSIYREVLQRKDIGFTHVGENGNRPERLKASGAGRA